MDVSHSVWSMYDQILSQKHFSVEDKLFPVLKHGFLRSEENVNLNNSKT